MSSNRLKKNCCLQFFCCFVCSVSKQSVTEKVSCSRCMCLNVVFSRSEVSSPTQMYWENVCTYIFEMDNCIPIWPFLRLIQIRLTNEVVKHISCI